MSDLRSAFLKSNPFRSRVIEVSVPQAEGPPELLKVKIKQPSVRERNEIFAETKVSKGGEVNAGAGAATGARAIVYCARHPDTDEPIFGIEDLDALLNTPAGGWVDVLAGKVMEILVEAQDAAKK